CGGLFELPRRVSCRLRLRHRGVSERSRRALAGSPAPIGDRNRHPRANRCLYSFDALCRRLLSPAHAADARNPARGCRSLRPETQRYLDKARLALAHARAILEIELGEDAGRAAYLAALHAAQALI